MSTDFATQPSLQQEELVQAIVKSVQASVQGIFTLLAEQIKFDLLVKIPC